MALVRVQVYMLSADVELNEAALLSILESGHSRIPVHKPGNKYVCQRLGHVQSLNDLMYQVEFYNMRGTHPWPGTQTVLLGRNLHMPKELTSAFSVSYWTVNFPSGVVPRSSKKKSESRLS